MYEYKRIEVRSGNLEDILTKYAEDSWRLLKVWRIRNIGNYPGENDWYTHECILEREKSNKQRRVYYIEKGG